MGEPVKIDALARNLIRLTGHTPDGDIRIEYSGLRPGEKLFEEKLMAEEGLKKTANKLIHMSCLLENLEEILRETPVELEGAECKEKISALLNKYCKENYKNNGLLYYVIVAKEADRLEDLDANIKDFLSPLEECNSFVGWDDQGKCVHIQDTLPEEFDAEVANHIWFLAEEASERVNIAIKRLEGEG